MIVRSSTVGAIPPSVLEIATQVLVGNPAASLTDVARAAGMSRTTLHKLYPTRHALLVAVAEDALALVTQVYADAQLDVAGREAPAALLRLATGLVPLGPRLMFLDRERALDDEPGFLERVGAVDEPVRLLEQRAKAEGLFRSGPPDGWITGAFNNLVYLAWEQIAEGRLAPLAAPELVVSTLLDGLGGPSAAP